MMDYYAPPQQDWKAPVMEYVITSKKSKKPKKEKEKSQPCCPGGTCGQTSDPATVKEAVQDAYGEVATASDEGQCCGNLFSCCGTSAEVDFEVSQKLGYSIEDLLSVPEGANMGLGCGNPQLIAQLKDGETVLDLGSGGGFDVFLAAKKVGETGKAIGVDMTVEMLKKARANAQKRNIKNVEFLLGEIEHLPIGNDQIDVIISNCVINLSTDKEQVFQEAYRVLKEGGRLAISDIVATNPLPDEIKNDLKLHCACISGAMGVDELKQLLESVGFQEVQINVKEDSKTFIKNWAPEQGAENFVASAEITAFKA